MYRLRLESCFQTNKRRRSLAQARSSKRVSTTQPAKPKAVVVPTVSTEPTSSSMDKSESSTREEKKPPKNQILKVSVTTLLLVLIRKLKIDKVQTKGATKVKRSLILLKLKTSLLNPKVMKSKLRCYLTRTQFLKNPIISLPPSHIFIRFRKTSMMKMLIFSVKWTLI